VAEVCLAKHIEAYEIAAIPKGTIFLVTEPIDIVAG
jgi:hypothetical protein